ncbi:CwfJ C-terminus 1-domain-containing protein-like protein [Irpex rosettiformis]|uniref:CwfJ C-terminus 1-domain-containing protein-like protein n=1 Tax=Irpex rosettiformis TaxID=378272 RepID=A0ACB8UIX7_9APHY|nr:CwfJ C-terminus 1-domain-containing protein-like protein [Irpex rosettiformis]
MSTPPNVKILTVGSAAGSLRELFTKIKAIDAKHGKFDLVLCTGDFFGPPKDEGEEYKEDDEIIQLLNGKLEVPLECFIMQGEHSLPQPVIEQFAKTGGQLAHKIFLLHKSGVMTTAHGLRIACLGGIYDANLYSVSETVHGFTSPFFTSLTVEKLLANTMANSTDTKNSSYDSLAAIRAGSSNSQLIDILLTNAFPAHITAFSSAPLPTPIFPPPTLVSDPVADVVRRIKPRYHFVAGGGSQTSPQFWEREPFVWDGEDGRVTRFLSLGAFGGPVPATGKKPRWFYAFSISPQSSTPAPVSRPPNATKNPFTDVKMTQGTKRQLAVDDAGENFRWGAVKQGSKRSRTEATEPGKPPPGYKCKICESPDHFINDCPDRAKPKEGYVCKICNESGHFVRDCPVKNAVGDTGGKKPREGYVCRACGSENHYIQDCPTAQARPKGHRAPPKEIAPDSCWFCLSNPNLAKHLIVSIGSECYVTLPKGQIIPTHSASDHPKANIPKVPGGGHVLIVPITHYPTYATIPEDLARPIVEETNKYKSALRAFYAKHHCHPVSFEVGRLTAKGGHAHIQAVPVPTSISASTILDTFTKEGQRLGIDFEVQEPDEGDGRVPAGDRGYFKVDLPDGKRMVHWLRDGVPFGVQFGRQVLVSLLGMPERFDWKECDQDEEDDKKDVKAFKEAFSVFDPTL